MMDIVIPSYPIDACNNGRDTSCASIRDSEGENLYTLGYAICRRADDTSDMSAVTREVVVAGSSFGRIIDAIDRKAGGGTGAIGSQVGTATEIHMACINADVNHIRVDAC